jgi:hypothetical protein
MFIPSILYNDIMLTMPIGLASIDVQCSDS